MSHRPSPHPLLPHFLPIETMQRLTLFAVRRMGEHGIRDAHVASLFINTFGLHFRKPLVLKRAFMVELARAASGTISLAPCCAMRMTEDEARIVGILATAANNPACAADHLERLTGAHNIGAALTTAAAFSDTLAALGRPLSL